MLGFRIVAGFCALVAVVLETPQASSQSNRVGFQLLTTAEDANIDARTIVIRYEGPIVFPMAENLADIARELIGRFDKIVLDLDSFGGQLDHTEKVIGALREVRRQVTLHTLVRHGRSCLSACVVIFMQGQQRSAGGASVWLFHGPCPLYTNIPTAKATHRYVEMLREAGAGRSLLCELEDGQYLSRPGKFWLSGYELFHRKGASVITELLPSWQSEEPALPPFDPNVQHR